MTVAVIGAGIQGCSVALEVSLRRRHAVLFERLSQPMQGASRWNEGKIHLGYIYAGDRSMRTAETMIKGAMVFHRQLTAYLGGPVPLRQRSGGFVYGVHRDSLITADDAAGHLAAVDRLLRDALSVPGHDYLGERRLDACRRIDLASSPFNEALVQRSIVTPELAIDPHAVGDLVAARVACDGRITVLSGHTVAAITRTDDGGFRLQDAAGGWHGPFEAVVNTSWESRLALDRTLGYEPAAAWLHRYKLAIHGTRVPGSDAVPTVTIMLGPFGDVVNFGDGRLYLSWYPACRIASGAELLPPDPGADVTDQRRAAIAAESIESLGRIVPALRSMPDANGALAVRGGHIFAWGTGDIADRESRLHERYAIGVHSDRGYHSVDTGKYGMAPLHAMEVARRVTGDA